jgi:predicted 3-demethylubiquinone-9 3-methyltransferase (glyoxalase superfamily)
MTVSFELDGQEFVALNGGPKYSLTPAISFVVHCESQQEIDYYWDKLLQGGAPVQCGWLTDKYGLSWQVVPTKLNELFKGAPERSQRVMQAMLQMVKLDIGRLTQAYEGS